MINNDLNSFNSQINPALGLNHENSKKKIVRIKFTPQEDEELSRLVSIYGDKDWIKISEELNKKFQDSSISRTPKQCKDRYSNYLSPDLSNREWTNEEDQYLILRMTINDVNSWKSLKQFLPGRSEVAIKNRFNYLHRNFMKDLKPKIAYGISHTTLVKNNGMIEIVSSKNKNKNINQQDFIQQFNLNSGLSYIESIKKSFNSVININNERNDFSPNSANYLNQQNINSQNNSSSNQPLNKKVKKDGETVPMQWVEAAKTIIEAAKAEETKTSISEIKLKTKSLYNIIENRAFLYQQNNIENLFNFEPESDQFDPDLFGML